MILPYRATKRMRRTTSDGKSAAALSAVTPAPQRAGGAVGGKQLSIIRRFDWSHLRPYTQVFEGALKLHWRQRVKRGGIRSCASPKPFSSNASSNFLRVSGLLQSKRSSSSLLNSAGFCMSGSAGLVQVMDRGDG